MLAAAGANTFRTWGAGPELSEQLDEAQELGLTVVIGHWLGHPRHGFDYNDLDMVAEQFERVQRDVLAYRDHPALLMWSVGNEMEGLAEGDDTAKAERKGVKLKREWKRYSIDLEDKDLSRVKTPFVWFLGGRGRPVTFYLDDIRFE